RVILIATGATPFKPAIPGAELGITSNEAFQLEKLPGRILIAGGGYVAVEFAGIFNGLGVNTVVAYRGTQILRGFDQDLRDGLAEEMRHRGVEIRVNADIASLSRKGKAIEAQLTDGTAVETDAVMLATGRAPNTAGLGLERAGIAQGPKGRVVVDGLSRTSGGNIYAVGDVTDRINLTPVAIREGQAFADSVFGGAPEQVDHKNVPTAVFSTPEVGTVGLPEEMARKTYGEVDVYKSRFRPMRHTLSGRQERMLMKLVVERSGGRVVGCHILGPDAAEIVQVAAIAIRLGAKKRDFDQTMALHPSAAEELVTMREKWQPPKAAE
ncbi:MAG: glutathione-disulfide reductase, partial [Hyphomicrobiaceae bacterium]